MKRREYWNLNGGNNQFVADDSSVWLDPFEDKINKKYKYIYCDDVVMFVPAMKQ